MGQGYISQLNASGRRDLWLWCKDRGPWFMGSRFSETLSSVGNGRACLLHSLTETILQGCFYAAGLNIYLPPTPITAQHAPSHFIPPVCRSIVSSLALFASSLLFCNQGAQVANPRLLHMADLCFSIAFASCCFSFSLVLQAAVTTLCYENIWICFSLGVHRPMALLPDVKVS